MIKLKELFAKFIAKELEADTLVITCGLPASAKTWLAERMSRMKGYPCLQTDAIRLELLKGEDIFDEVVAADMDKRTGVYDEMFSRADRILEKGDGLILDATFVTQSLRRQAAAIAAKHDKKFVIVETYCVQEVALARIRGRSREGALSNAITEQAYFNNRDIFEKVDLDDLKSTCPNISIMHLIVNTSEDSPEDREIIAMHRR